MIPSTLFCNNCGGANQAFAAYCRFCGSALYIGKRALYHSTNGLLLAGILLKQRYRIFASIGKGGMGAVYQAEDTQLGDRQVAIKEMSQGGLKPLEQQAAADAFRHEAVMLARLNHPNLPSIFDHFEENGRWYLVMSFIEGETLEDYLLHTPNFRLPASEVMQIGIVLCTVLGYLHNQHPAIIFRDLKPANIMRTVDENLYLIDFGIARHFKPGQTRDTAYYGSMGYAPPEQYGKTQTTPRSDLYSLGAILYQLLSGHDPSATPFRFPPLPDLVPNVPAGLAALIAQMLAMDEEQRPASALLVKQELQALLVPPTRPVLPAWPVVPPPVAPAFIARAPTPLTRPTLLPSALPYQMPVEPAPVLTKEQWLDTGNTHSRAKRYTEALNAYEEALRLDAGFAYASKHKGLTLYLLHRYEESLAVCEQALRADPADIDLLACKADALEALGRYEEALRVYEELIRLAPTDARSYYGKARILEAFNHRAEALVVLEEAIRLAPNDVRGYYSKADILEALDRREEALIVLEQAVRLAPNDIHGYRTVAILLETLEHNEEALSVREQIIHLDANDAYNYYYKGSLLEKLNRLPEALSAYQEAMRLAPMDDFMYQCQGSVLGKLTRYEEALSAYEAALRLKPDSASAHRGRGNILQLLGRQEEAEEAYISARQYESP
jgi:tetratricopeptide (TPR) repeat protein/tRNA A-37 threonylcarbamoyl transferase component Bud32